MLKRLYLPSIFAILAYGFWISPDFKEIAAGLAIFLFGMVSLEEGFRAFTGGTLEAILRATTDKLWKSIGFGIVTTSIMQSSSLVSLITISFLSADLLSLAAGIGIIFGANLGTTTGAWLIAGFGLKVDISSYAMPLIVFGVILFLQKAKLLKGVGYGLMGLGFLFLGIYYMKEGFDAFKDTINLAQYAVPGYAGLFLFALVGVAVTVVMQSSHATLLLTITALAAGQITYENALALAVGANVGTTVTALLGAVSANVDGKRLAVAHLIFNLVTGLVAIGLIYQLVWLVDKLSAGLGIAADDYTLKLALFHTIFNLIGLLIMMPLVNKLVDVLRLLVKVPAAGREQPRYLNEAAMEIPAAAVEAVRKEIVHLYDNAFGLFAQGINLRRGAIVSDHDLAAAVARGRRRAPVDIDEYYERNIKGLHSAIIEFISRVQAQQIPTQWSDELYALRQASRDIVEAVKAMKHLYKNLARYMFSANEHIRRQYNGIRLFLANVLREIADFQVQGLDTDSTETILSLDAVKLRLENFDRGLNADLDELIRNKQISPNMATSLMNDSAYAYAIGQRLVAMAQTLFVARARDLKHAEQQLTLDEADIEDVLRSDRDAHS